MEVLKQRSIRKIVSLGSFRKKRDSHGSQNSGSVPRTSSWSSIFSRASDGGSSKDLKDDVNESTVPPFERKMSRIRKDKRQRKVVLKEFVQRSTTEEVLNLRDVLDQEDRSWRYVKFTDTVRGEDFSSWQSKRKVICRHLLEVAEDKGIDLVFQGMLEISFDSMTAKQIGSLLTSVCRDSTISVIRFSGALHSRDVSTILRALAALLTYDDRPWNSVVLQAEIGECELGPWMHAMNRASRFLEDLAIRCNIPIALDIFH
ncbi:hypothetical protein SEMRO_743_G196120.1 [Seminavis robusta]|uniref:Uncharacterized protein n=1 Tax=Seminavis robusta TaxID=568900 RepID=A0A9N8EC84_9STRA|nr:hypothetical protein SEMRO_743_G196120.1 [Seminavis robusta]|eukprot:Sro743_g196120.1 n/a (259) ;mRNA; r:44740-45516